MSPGRLPLRRNPLSEGDRSLGEAPVKSDRCAVCGADAPAGTERCDRCGFPRALAVTVPPAGARPPEAVPTSPPGAGAEARAGPKAAVHRSGVTSAAAKELFGRADRLRELGLDTKPVELALRDAALREAWGDTDAAVAEIRRSSERLDAAVAEALGSRLSRLTSRRAKLVDAGVEVAADPALGTVPGLLEHGDVSNALEILRASETSVDRTASAWTELEEAFGEVAGLRDLALRLGFSVGEVSDRVGPARSGLGSGTVRTAQIAPALREARRELEELSRALSDPAREMLDDLTRRSESADLDPLETNRLRALGDRAAYLLADRHVADALRALIELKEAVAPFGGRAPEGPQPSAATTSRSSGATKPSRAGPAAEISAESLLAKARSFASKVRALPPDSSAAREAAAQIREATDLLRQGRLAEADATLTRLMRTFGDPEARNDP